MLKLKNYGFNFLVLEAKERLFKINGVEVNIFNFSRLTALLQLLIHVYLIFISIVENVLNFEHYESHRVSVIHEVKEKDIG